MRKSSRTAIGVAAIRAAHQLVDAEPRILEDPIILKLLGIETLDTIQEDRDRYQTPGSLALRSHIVLRSRYAEDRLAQAVLRGVTQYVILGAGLDTFAYRQPPWARDLRIFEIDRAPMQREKRERLSLSRVFVPDNVIFGSIDFERERLVDTLAKYGLDIAQPTFFSWLGVTMYLTEAAVLEVLRDVMRFPKGSEIVFTFAPAPTGDDVVDEALQRFIAELAASAGEPWQTYFKPDDLAARLGAEGFSNVELIEPSEAAARYYVARKDDLPPPRRRMIVSATV
ncbi:MAG TPA: class I SAM-dependent methyltransferase [Gemmatimonadaceae bacterium]|nr:class I SAM-dependent methyltransferase [Gemmatimonadaceae bacterium]